MAVVAGVDFGTLSVRVSMVDSERGLLASAIAEYPLHRKREDPEYATQSHEDHMRALAAATREVVREKLAAIDWCGGVYSSEWGFSKLLHWLRHNPTKRPEFVSAFEHCDMVAATLCGITDAKRVKRSVCAMGHKWLWNASLGGLPPEGFLVKVDPLLAGVREKIDGEFATSEQLAGRLSPHWAQQLGLKAGIPIPVGAFDAHWDAIGAGCRSEDIVNVVGTSTCIIGITPSVRLVPGVCGVVQGSVHPQRTGIEAGLSAVGDIFQAIATRAATDVPTLCLGLENYRPGQTGLLRITWDNGDRTVLVNPNLRGITFGWNLQTTAQDELFAAIEGTALHTRVILDRMEEHGVIVRRVINAGGIPQKNDVLNQIYANVLGRPVLVPAGSVISLGSAIFALLAAGVFKTIEEAQDKICPQYKVFQPQIPAKDVYGKLYAFYSKVYFAFGRPQTAEFGNLLPGLIQLAESAHADPANE